MNFGERQATWRHATSIERREGHEKNDILEVVFIVLERAPMLVLLRLCRTSHQTDMGKPVSNRCDRPYPFPFFPNNDSNLLLLRRLHVKSLSNLS